MISIDIAPTSGKKVASPTCILAPERAGTGPIWLCWSCTDRAHGRCFVRSCGVPEAEADDEHIIAGGHRMQWAWTRGLRALALKRGAPNLSGGLSGLQMMRSCTRMGAGSSLSGWKAAALRMPGTVQPPHSAEFNIACRTGVRGRAYVFSWLPGDCCSNGRCCVINWGHRPCDHWTPWTRVSGT